MFDKCEGCDANCIYISKSKVIKIISCITMLNRMVLKKERHDKVSNLIVTETIENLEGLVKKHE